MRPAYEPPTNKNRSPHHESYYNTQGDDEQLGGLANSEGITNKNFYEMLEIVLVFNSPYTVTIAGGDIVPQDGVQLQPGKY